MYSLHGHSVRQMLFSLHKPHAKNFIGENLENVFVQGKKFNKKKENDDFQFYIPMLSKCQQMFFSLHKRKWYSINNRENE